MNEEGGPSAEEGALSCDPYRDACDEFMRGRLGAAPVGDEPEGGELGEQAGKSRVPTA